MSQGRKEICLAAQVTGRALSPLCAQLLFLSHVPCASANTHTPTNATTSTSSGKPGTEAFYTHSCRCDTFECPRAWGQAFALQQSWEAAEGHPGVLLSLQCACSLGSACLCSSSVSPWHFLHLLKPNTTRVHLEDCQQCLQLSASSPQHEQLAFFTGGAGGPLLGSSPPAQLQGAPRPPS